MIYVRCYLGHGVFYISNGQYGTISTDETVEKKFVLEPEQDYEVVCSGVASEWRDIANNPVRDCPNNGGVCQDKSVAGEAGLVFSGGDAPFEYVCRVNFDREDHFHTILFLHEDTGSYKGGSMLVE